LTKILSPNNLHTTTDKDDPRHFVWRKFFSSDVVFLPFLQLRSIDTLAFLHHFKERMSEVFSSSHTRKSARISKLIVIKEDCASLTHYGSLITALITTLSSTQKDPHKLSYFLDREQPPPPTTKTTIPKFKFYIF